MRIEVLATGNELLDGSVVDTNAAYFAQKVFALGERLAYKQTVPDEVDVIAQTLREVGQRADFALVSGGLGPTVDDLTLDAAALAAGVPLELDAQLLERLKERFAKRNIAFSDNNARQARVPKGGTAVHNPFGSAPMVALRIGKAECYFLPGVPREFRGLVNQEVLPRLAARLASEPSRVFRASRVLKTNGLPESHLDRMVAGLPARHPHVRLGFRTHAPENHLKLLAEGATAAEAEARLQAAEAEARAILGERCFGDERDELPAVALAALRAAGATVALAESCTGGLCASLLASTPGASDVLVSSAVVYQERAKSQLLGVDPALVARAGAVSAEVTRALALAAREKAGSTFGAAITGWAGPSGGTPADPVGTVYLCLTDGTRFLEERQRYGFDRERVRHFAAAQVIDLLRRHARGLPR